MKKIIAFSFLVFCSTLLHAQKVFEFNSTCQQAYQEILKLKINSGLALVEKAKQQNPDNLIPLLLESYADFYILFLNEDPKDYASRFPKFAERYSLISEGPKTSPFYNYSLSMVKLHQAGTSIKFGKLWDGGWGVRK